jgi:hypothetical protein
LAGSAENDVDFPVPVPICGAALNAVTQQRPRSSPGRTNTASAAGERARLAQLREGDSIILGADRTRGCWQTYGRERFPEERVAVGDRMIAGETFDSSGAIRRVAELGRRE